MNQRLFVRKKPSYRTEEEGLRLSLSEKVQHPIEALTLFTVYDVSQISEEDLIVFARQVASDPLVDEVVKEDQITARLELEPYLGIKPLEGQYDARSDAAEQCLRLLCPRTTAKIRASRLIFFSADVTPEILDQIRQILINPVDSEEKDFSIFDEGLPGQSQPLPVFEDFLTLSEAQLKDFLDQQSLAMSLADLKMVQEEFQKQGRIPTAVEIKILDTYWSDHCRHTTFNTALEKKDNHSQLYPRELEQQWTHYLALRKKNNRLDKPQTLMEMATLVSRDLRRQGLLQDLEVSDEINACSVRVDVQKGRKKEPWYLMFKNETHNHPTEIEPFGGASTCLGGAIRDPLSGRAYVYQALRITGAGDITEAPSDTLPNKLPQRQISTQACQGYSSYGNQIGLATTAVREYYHPGYRAKRLELGAVVAAVPSDHLRRENARPGDQILLIGGRTGRDGVGGATGSSKAQTKDSLRLCGAEVQKGNPVIERKIQRLFRREDVATKIRKCNDFGAGGVSVAIGELADGLDINLDLVPLKYDGLNALEIAVSESQERMALLVAPEDVTALVKACEEENLEAVAVATVNDERRLRMTYRGETVVDLSRDFLDTNGAPRQQTFQFSDPKPQVIPEADFPIFPQKMAARHAKKEALLKHLSQINYGSQEGMVEQFDSTIGRSTVLFPYGGKTLKSEESVSAQTLPVPGGTPTCSVMSYGYRPDLADISPYLMGQYSVIEALSKLVAAGLDYSQAWLTCQEYFQRLDQDEEAWGLVVQTLLGLIQAEEAFGVAAVGGKDSMSGSFESIHVPPTLVTFAIGVTNQDDVVSATIPALEPNKTLYLYYLPHEAGGNGLPDYHQLRSHFRFFNQLCGRHEVLAASPLKPGGLIETLVKMAVGNDVGLTLLEPSLDLYQSAPGGIVFCTDHKLEKSPAGCTLQLIAKTVSKDGAIRIHGETSLLYRDALAAMESAYDQVYPIRNHASKDKLPDFASQLATDIDGKDEGRSCLSSARSSTNCETGEDSASSTPVRILLPVFPGSNCEYDTAEAFQAAGATDIRFHLIRNLTPEQTLSDLEKFREALEEADILAFSGGFSFGDEPDGSAKFIVNVLRKPDIREAILRLTARGGLVLGICNGFQALVKSGFLPYGDPNLQSDHSPTLFRNTQGRHVSRIIQTRVCSTASPWLSGFQLGQVHTLPVSHGEGRFVVLENEAKRLFESGQVAFQYVDPMGRGTLDEPWNPNGSSYGIEGMISPDGRILGKMGHSERFRPGLLKNIPDIGEQAIFANAVCAIRLQKEKGESVHA